MISLRFHSLKSFFYIPNQNHYLNLNSLIFHGILLLLFLNLAALHGWRWNISFLSISTLYPEETCDSHNHSSWFQSRFFICFRLSQTWSATFRIRSVIWKTTFLKEKCPHTHNLPSWLCLSFKPMKKNKQGNFKLHSSLKLRLNIWGIHS